MPNQNQIDLLSGGCFAYLFVMPKYKSGIEIRNRLLMYHLEGLLAIINRIEHKSIPETITIVGTSYFFNIRTLHKMGFEMEHPSLFYRLNLYVNFNDVVWMYFLSQVRFSIPNIWNAKKASISGIQFLNKCGIQT